MTELKQDVINPHIELDEGPVKEKKKKITNHVAILLDRSGSMETISKEAIDAVNEQLKTIRSACKKVNTKLTYATFSTKADEPLLFEKPIKEMKDLDIKDYKPDGMTAMLDAVGSMINRLKALPDADKEDTTFLMVIVSDGQENNSKNFNHNGIAELVKPLQDTNRWTFVYLGANQDLSKASEKLGIHAGNMRSFAANTKGVATASLHTTRSMDAYYDRIGNGEMASFNLYSSTAETEEDRQSILPDTNAGQVTGQAIGGAAKKYTVRAAVIPDTDDKNKTK